MDVPKPKKLLDQFRDALRVKRYAYSADPLSGLEQKADSLCLPNLELLSFALACVA